MKGKKEGRALSIVSLPGAYHTHPCIHTLMHTPTHTHLHPNMGLQQHTCTCMGIVHLCTSHMYVNIHMHTHTPSCCRPQASGEVFSLCARAHTQDNAGRVPVAPSPQGLHL